MSQMQKKEKTEGATGLGRVTKKQIEKWNKMTAPIFLTGGRHQKCMASNSAPHKYCTKLLLSYCGVTGWINW